MESTLLDQALEGYPLQALRRQGVGMERETFASKPKNQT